MPTKNKKPSARQTKARVGSVAGSEIGLPEYLAREIFKLGDLADQRCHRMSYKIGRWTPDHSEERDNGGICEDSLVTLIADRLRRHSPNTPDEPRD